jgi:hypothetical protein
MKRYSFTHLDTIKTYDGDAILFEPRVIATFMKSTYYKNVLNLTPAERDKYFEMSWKYKDILTVLFDSNMEHTTEAGWVKKTDIRTPPEEFDNYVSQPKDEDLTDEEHELKLEYLKQYKDWFEKQN